MKTDLLRRPGWIQRSAIWLGVMAVPMAMFVVGLTMLGGIPWHQALWALPLWGVWMLLGEGLRRVLPGLNGFDWLSLEGGGLSQTPREGKKPDAGEGGQQVSKAAGTAAPDEEDRQRLHRVLHQTLQDSLEGVPLQTLFTRGLERLLQVPGVALQGRGAVFLTEPGQRQLRLFAHVNLSEGIQRRCAQVAFGECVCGRCAQSGLIIGMGETQGQDDCCHAGIPDHSHYCVPLGQSPRLIGVLNLYRPLGQPLPADVASFIRSFAAILAQCAEHERVLRMVEASERRHHALVEGSIQGILVHDGTRVLYYNCACAGIFGLPPMTGETSGMSLDALLSARELPPLGPTLDPLRAGDCLETHELEGRRQDGTPLCLMAVARTIPWNDGMAFLTTIVDISGRKAAERELRRAMDNVARANKAKGELLSALNHDVRTPLHGIIGTVQRLLREPVGQRVRDMTRTIDQASERLLRVVNDMVDFAVDERQDMQLERRSFSVRVVLDELLESMGQRAQDKGLLLSGDVDPRLGMLFTGDPQRFRQVVQRLLANAIRHTHAGEVALDAQLASASAQHCRVVVTVRDTGHGIAPDVLPSMPNPSPCTQGVEASAEAGSALALCRKLARAMGGDLTARSRKGAGSEFVLEVVMESAVQMAEGVSSHGAIKAGSALLRVLLLDDDAIGRKVVRGMIEDLGHGVVDAVDGVAGLQILAREPDIDLVMTDLRMPGLDGLGVVRCIRFAEQGLGRPGRAVVALTADMQRGIRDQCLDAGMDDVLTKPLRLEALRQVLSRVMQARDSARVPGVGPREDVRHGDEATAALIRRLSAAGALPGYGSRLEERDPRNLAESCWNLMRALGLREAPQVLVACRDLWTRLQPFLPTGLEPLLEEVEAWASAGAEREQRIRLLARLYRQGPRLVQALESCRRQAEEQDMTEFCDGSLRGEGNGCLIADDPGESSVSVSALAAMSVPASSRLN
ncbi:MAG: response regulator [Magnetococcus sp. WYHC-3]